MEIVHVSLVILDVKIVQLLMELNCVLIALLTSNSSIVLALPALMVNMPTKEPPNAPTALLAALTALEVTQQLTHQMLVAQLAFLIMDIPITHVLHAQ